MLCDEESADRLLLAQGKSSAGGMGTRAGRAGTVSLAEATRDVNRAAVAEEMRSCVETKTAAGEVAAGGQTCDGTETGERARACGARATALCLQQAREVFRQNGGAEADFVRELARAARKVSADLMKIT